MPEFEKVELAGGRAVLYRADCLEVLAAGLLKCDAIVADPPYGIGFQHSGGGIGNLRSPRVESYQGRIVGDDMPFDPGPWLAAAPQGHREQKFRGRKIILWGATNYMQKLPGGGTLLAWDKSVGVGADDSFADAEYAWCGRPVKREVFRHLWKGLATNKTGEDGFSIKGARGNGKVFARTHVSQKPVALMRWCIQKLKPKAGGVILDPYAGSGTTGIAALSLGYRFIGVEIDPKHFDTACARIAEWWAKHGAGDG